MKMPTKEEQRHLARQMDAAHREIDRLRREALRGMPYNWKDVDALLELGDYSGCESRATSGLVEMQRLFMKATRRN